MSSRHRLRRSCAFCRARKIKCSNDTICEACRRQGADCIYDFEPPRPKTRNSLDTSISDSVDLQNQDFSLFTGRHRSSAGGSAKDSPMSLGLMTDESLLLDDVEDVATVLDQIYINSFISNPKTSHATVLQSEPGNLVSNPFRLSAPYSNILSLLAHDLISLSACRVSSLGNFKLENRGAGFFISGLDSDTTQAMFDKATPSINPINEYGQRQQTQLIDTWYSSHPLSFLVSKTLLLRELRDGTHDEVLLATMLADANFTIGSDIAKSRGIALLQYATSQLRLCPFENARSIGIATDIGTVVYSGISTRVFSGISTVQALILLGWNAMGLNQFRRTISYIQVAGRLAIDLKKQVINSNGINLSSRINGINVYDVEKQLIDYLYWTTYSFILWMNLHTTHGTSSMRPVVLTPIFIPQSEESSASIQLDLVSENINTIQKQKSSIREIWSLAHIAISVAHVCGFHPQQNAKLVPDLVHRCRDTKNFLMKRIHSLNTQGTDACSTSFVLIVYHTLVIQLLFPEQAEAFSMVGVVDQLCYSAQQLLHILEHVSELPHIPSSTDFPIKSLLPSAFGLALDTCSRALRMIYSQSQTKFSPVQDYDPVLEAMAGRLYVASKNDFLDQRSSLRATRKQLKASMRGFSRCGFFDLDQSPSSSDSVAFSPSHGSPALSPRSDLSIVTTPEADCHITLNETVAIPHTESAGGHFFTNASTNPHNQPMCHPLATSSLEVQSSEDLAFPGLFDLQHAWLPQMPPLMEGEVEDTQWDWSDQIMKEDTIPLTAMWSDTDMIL